VSVRAVPALPLVEVTTRAAWTLRGAGTKVTFVGAELAAKYVESAAFVAVTVHVPAAVASSLPYEIRQPAVPELLMTYVTSPVPEPPLVVRRRAAPTVP
jgi:hypothetical protein